MSARGWVAFAGVTILWGIPYLLVRVAVDGGVPPIFLAWSRVMLAAVLVGVIAWRSGVLGSARGKLRWLAVYGLVDLAAPLPLIAAGERRVASSLAAIIIAAVPLIVAVLALRFEPSERVDRRRLVGLLVGFAGVIALVGVDVAGHGAELLGACEILLAAVCYAVGLLVLNRHLGSVDPRAMTAAALVFAAVALTPEAAFSAAPSHPSVAALLSLAALAVFCTAAALILYAVLVAEIGAARSAVINYVVPVLAVALGVSILGERPGSGAIAGLLLILAGSWLSTDGRLPPGVERLLAARGGSRGAVDERAIAQNSTGRDGDGDRLLISANRGPCAVRPATRGSTR